VVYGLAFTPDGSRLVSGSADGTVRLWDVPGRRLIETYRWHESWVTCVAVSPDGMTAAAGGNDTRVVVWDLADV
jgi:WD40 repeat protein